MDIDKMLEEVQRKKTLSDDTIVTYKHLMQSFINKGYDPRKPEDYNKYIIDEIIKKNQQPVNKKSALKYMAKYFLPEKESIKVIEDFTVVRNYQQTRKSIYLDKAKLNMLIDKLKNPKHKIMALVCMATGIRVGDAFNIKLDDIHIETFKDDNSIRIDLVGKRSKVNNIYIYDPDIKNELLYYLTNTTFQTPYAFIEAYIKSGTKSKSFAIEPLTGIVKILNWNTLKKVNYNNACDDMTRAVSSMGIPEHQFNWHDLRRCYARRVYESKGNDINYLQKALNHSDPSTSLRYLKNSGLSRIELDKEMQIS